MLCTTYIFGSVIQTFASVYHKYVNSNEREENTTEAIFQRNVHFIYIKIAIFDKL